MKRQTMMLNELMKDIPHTALTGGDAVIAGLASDTRRVQRGDLLFCIKGLHYDAHDYINEAAALGAAAVVVERPGAYDCNIPVVCVESSRKAMSLTAEIFYGNPSREINFYGVTGTNGKTSVTYFIESILRAAGRRAGVIGTLNATIDCADIGHTFSTSTTPDTLELYGAVDAMRGAGVTDVVMEVSSHSLALFKTDGIRYKTGVFTNLTRDHLDFHGTMDNYLQAKARLFDLCETGVINADDAASKTIVKNAACRIVTYGINGGDIRAAGVRYGDDGLTFAANIDGERVLFEAPVYGRINVYNALAAIGAAMSAGIPIDVIREGLAGLKPIPGRFQRISNDKGFKIIIDYAHSPDGLDNVLKTAREMCAGRLISVFGCGGDRDRPKRAMMGQIAGTHSDWCIITSDNPRSEIPADIINEIERGIKQTSCGYDCIEDRREAIYRGIRMAAAGDTVFIAGKGHENYQEFNGYTIHFSDAETADEALKS